MDTENSAPDSPDPYNDALAAVLRARKAELRLTFDEIAAASGINLRTVNRLIAGQRPITFGNSIKLCVALDLDLAEVVESVESRVAKTLA